MIDPINNQEGQSCPNQSDFDVLLAEAQPRLKGYVASILGGWADVDDLVQETNMVLLLKRDTFILGTNFIAWAFRIAYFKSTRWRRDRMREGRVVLNEYAFQEIAGYAEDYFKKCHPAADALKDCLKQLSPEEQKLVHVKYVEETPLVNHAVITGLSAQALHKKISRIRIALRACVERKIGQSKQPKNF